MEFRAKLQKMFCITKKWLNIFKNFVETFAVCRFLCKFAADKTKNDNILMEKIKALPQLDFVSAVKLAAGRLTDFKGRSRRSEFWWWMAVVMVVQVAVDYLLRGYHNAVFAADVLIMCCALSVTTRRLQDAGYNAVWVFLSFILGIVMQLFPSVTKVGDFLVEYNMIIERHGVRISESQIDALIDQYGSPLMWYFVVVVAFCITSLVVVVLCMLDSKPMTNKYGPSPKYIVEDEQPQMTEKADL